MIMSEDKDLTKLKMLMNAINEVKEEENQEEELDDEVDFYTELKEAAWNILHENPGIDFGDWQDMLIENTQPRLWTHSAQTLLMFLQNFLTGGTPWTMTMACWRYHTRSGIGQNTLPRSGRWNSTTCLLRLNVK